jgi:hypothetical protein
MTTKTKLCLASWMVACLVSGAAQAAGDGFYVGAGWGHAKGAADFDSAVAVSQSFGATVISTRSDGDRRAARILAGYNLSENLGVELNYTDLGENNATVYNNAATSDTYIYNITGAGVALVGYVPVERAALFGKVGLFAWESEITTEINGLPAVSTGEKDTALMLGVGLTYRITKHLGLRGEIERLGIDKNKAGMGSFTTATMNVLFHF